MSKKYQVTETVESETAFPMIDKSFDTLKEAEDFYDSIDIKYHFITEQDCATVKNKYRAFTKALVKHDGYTDEYIKFEAYDTYRYEDEYTPLDEKYI